MNKAIIDSATNLYDIYEPAFVPFWATWPFIALVSALLIAIIIGLALYCRAVIIARRPKIIPPPWQWANHELELLQFQLDAGQVNEQQFYSKLTYIIKEYLSFQLPVSVAQKTDSELAACISDLAPDAQLIEPLCELLSKALVVKFARQPASDKQMREDIERAYVIVLHMKPTEKQPIEKKD